jgi:undecaprenyl diphosphate synthase
MQIVQVGFLRQGALIKRASGQLMGFALPPLYRAYEARLTREVHAHSVPRHIGIILDGNRRHAERRGLHDPGEIYALGAAKLDDVLDWCSELAVPAVTLWVFSTDNWGRPLDQVSGILGAVEAKVRTLADHPKIHRQRVRVQAIGRLELLPASLREAIRATTDATARYEGMILTIAVAYGGRNEIVDAVRALVAEQAERGLSMSDAMPEITGEAIAPAISIPPAHLTPIWSSERAAKSACLGSSCGRAHIANSISAMCRGLLFVKSISCGPCGRISNESGGLGDDERPSLLIGRLMTSARSIAG